jgi:hypothetical protein
MKKRGTTETHREVIDGKPVMWAYGSVEEMDRSFDYEFWQRQSSTDRFAAAWDLARFYHMTVKKEDEAKLRLQRPIEVLQRQRR